MGFGTRDFPRSSYRSEPVPFVGKDADGYVALNASAANRTAILDLGPQPADELLLHCEFETDASTSVTSVTLTFREKHPDATEYANMTVMSGSGTLTGGTLVVSRTVSADSNWTCAIPVKFPKVEIVVDVGGSADANDTFRAFWGTRS